MNRTLKALSVLVLSLAVYPPFPGHAVVPGSKVTVTFEGLAYGRREVTIAEYDGLNWGGPIWAAAKGAFKTDPGFQSVIQKHVAGVILYFGGSGSITPVTGLMSVTSGHFAAFGGGGVRDVTFNAYRNNVLVGTLFVNQMQPVDTPIQFDKTFSNIDRFEIIGQVAFDNLVVKFSN